MSLAILHNVVPELEKAGFINDTICYDGQSTPTSKPAYVGYIEDYKIKHAGQDSGICVSFYDGTDGVGNQHCSTTKTPYFIKPSKCKHMKGGMRRTKRRSARRRTQRRRSARRRTQRGGLFGWGPKPEPKPTVADLRYKIKRLKIYIREQESAMVPPEVQGTHHTPIESNKRAQIITEQARLDSFKRQLESAEDELYEATH